MNTKVCPSHVERLKKINLVNGDGDDDGDGDGDGDSDGDGDGDSAGNTITASPKVKLSPVCSIYFLFFLFNCYCHKYVALALIFLAV